VKDGVLLERATVGKRPRTTTTTTDKTNREVNEPKVSNGGKDALEDAGRLNTYGVRLDIIRYIVYPQD
jgi:hypothetical protein